MTLPIREIEGELLTQLGGVRRAVICAPTGSGKSTQIPQILLDRLCAGRTDRIAVLQPRRLAARMLAARVARERGGEPGGEVGYQVRFDDCTSSATRIAYLTEGILARRLASDPRLDGVAWVILDEFHERHLYGDLMLARLSQLQASDRPDLGLLVMSATLDPEPVAAYLGGCPVIRAEGRAYPVEIEYLARAPVRDEPPWETAAEAWERIAARTQGDALVFMPGRYEIERTVEAIRAGKQGRGVEVRPLHGELAPAEQDAAVTPGERRRVIVATNVAETSITIEGIQVVLDSGLARVARFDPRRGIDTLLVQRISRASADQRAGRAGRTAPGRCVRLWTERDHAGRALHEEPEIRRADLAEALLLLRATGVRDPAAFPWFEAPDPGGFQRAELLLHDLGAVDRGGHLTEIGRRMAAFPAHPRYARMLIEAGRHGCVFQAALVAALTQGRDLLVHGGGRETAGRRAERLGEEAASDFLIRMRAWSLAERSGFDVHRCRGLGIHAGAARQVRPLLEHFLRIARQQGLPVERRAAEDEALQRSVLAAFSDQVAMRIDRGTRRCVIVHGRTGSLARESAVSAPLFVTSEIREIEGRELKVVAGLATAIERTWLEEMYPGDFESRTEVFWDRGQRRVRALRQDCFRDLVLDAAPLDRPPPEQAAALLADLAARGEVPLPKWDHRVDQWIARVNLLSREASELGIPAFGEEDRRTVLEQLCLGAVSEKDLAGHDPWPLVQDWLDPVRRSLVERHAPAEWRMPDGRRAKLVYHPANPPVLSRRIQDLYGLNESPRVVLGRVVVTVEILGPHFRPVQATSDMAGFWQRTYPALKKELQRRYPKHEWR